MRHGRLASFFQERGGENAAKLVRDYCITLVSVLIIKYSRPVSLYPCSRDACVPIHTFSPVFHLMSPDPFLRHGVRSSTAAPYSLALIPLPSHPPPIADPTSIQRISTQRRH